MSRSLLDKCMFHSSHGLGTLVRNTLHTCHITFCSGQWLYSFDVRMLWWRRGSVDTAVSHCPSRDPSPDPVRGAVVSITGALTQQTFAPPRCLSWAWLMYSVWKWRQPFLKKIQECRNRNYVTVKKNIYKAVDCPYCLTSGPKMQL